MVYGLLILSSYIVNVCTLQTKRGCKQQNRTFREEVELEKELYRMCRKLGSLIGPGMFSEFKVLPR